ncbi:MAG TPA: glucose-1-phosphate adenylyltransferase [Bdellovibrionota bacterium]|nr:glucose-1-phosphate adenylyltransferase [Bdellovibrionota bacterium]
MTVPAHGVLAVVLAGGEGKRLWPLSRRRAKPAIPFGGQYRVIDFVMTNLIHSNLFRIHVLTQYQSYSLIRHLSRGWSFSSHLGQYCEIIPATSGEGRGWYLGSADALFQNLGHMVQGRPKMIVILGADHIYRMDIRQMIDEHVESGADASIAVVPQPREEAHRFGCIQTDEKMRVVHFLEKPSVPPPFAAEPKKSLASMGNYIFNFDVLREVLQADHEDPQSRHDIGGDVLVKWFDRLHVRAYNYMNNRIPGVAEAERGYWRDVGTIEAYWKASMDLVEVSPVFNLYNDEWPILTARSDEPPAKFVFADKDTNRIGIATDSLVASGCIVSGGQINRSVLSPRVRVNSYSDVDECVLFDSVDIGRRCKIRRTIIDKEVHVPPDTRIGFDEEEDLARGIVVDECGVRVVPRDIVFTSV